MVPSPPATITLQEAAATLGVHYMTAYRYVRLGLLEAEKVGTTWQVSVDAVEQLGTTAGEAVTEVGEAISDAGETAGEAISDAGEAAAETLEVEQEKAQG